MSDESELKWHLNANGLSNEVIEDLLNFTNFSIPFFGVKSMFAIPLKIASKDCFSLIVNVGAHFVCIYGTPKQINFIDSFGRKPSVYDKCVTRFLKKCNRPVYYNARQIQDLTSSFCGMYAAMFCLFFAGKHRNNVNTLSFSDKNLLINDTKCYKYIKQLIY